VTKLPSRMRIVPAGATALAAGRPDNRVLLARRRPDLQINCPLISHRHPGDPFYTEAPTNPLTITAQTRYLGPSATLFLILCAQQRATGIDG